MAIETQCTGCGRLLRVGDEHAGKQARCPVCQNIYVVPQPQSQPYQAPSVTQDRFAEARERETAPPPSPDNWYLQTSDGQVYGPVSKSGLDKWATEGRIDATCRLRPGHEGVWVDAGEVYSQLGLAQRPVTANPFAERYATAGTSMTSIGTYHLPHRGAIVLMLGVLTWFLQCPLFGLAAWLMGSRDLGEMRAGRMDPAGEGLTQVGRILGMIHVLVFVGLLAMAALMVLFAIIANAVLV